MNEYIFYTAEGHTIAPNENYDVENCQLLGSAMGKDKVEAKERLLKVNPWIVEAGYNPIKFIVRRLYEEG